MTTENYIYTSNPKNLKYDIHPKMEIYRGKMINKLCNHVYEICKKYNPAVKQAKINIYVILFCWKNISDNDPVVPYNAQGKYDVQQLLDDLITNELPNLMNELKLIPFLEKCMKKINKKITKINFNKKIKINDTGKQLFYKKHNVKYSDIVIDKLNKFYNNAYSGDKKIIYFCILYRYEILGADNQQLAMSSSFKEDLKKTMNLNVELFGSSVNRYFDNYCSLFYDLEKYFGSLGNFSDIKLIKGLYFANPPFDLHIMETMVYKLIEFLKNTSHPLGFIITIPVWDGETQKKINKQCKTYFVSDLKYRARELIVNSGYMYKEYIFCKNDFPYYNFTKEQHINAANTYIYIIKNELLEFNIRVFEKLLFKNKLKFIR